MLLNRESAIAKLTLSDRLAQPIAKNTRCCLVVVEKNDLVQKKHDRRNNSMIIAQIESQIRYVTNVDGEITDVLVVPVELWQQLISSINSDHVSGLAWIDEQEPKAQILADLQQSVRQAAAGQTFPASELWDDIKA
jgi:hypothetical protein